MPVRGLPDGDIGERDSEIVAVDVAIGGDRDFVKDMSLRGVGDLSSSTIDFDGKGGEEDVAARGNNGNKGRFFASIFFVGIFCKWGNKGKFFFFFFGLS